MELRRGEGRLFAGRGQAGGWSVRAHLVAIVVAVVVVFVVLGALLGRDTWANAERDVRADAGSVAEVAAESLAHNVELVWSQLASTAANPAVPQLLAEPTECPIEFDLALFPGSHLDLVGNDGTIVCSSAAPAGGADHGGAPWLANLAETDRMFEGGPFVDAITEEPALVYAAPVDGADGHRLGGVVVVLPTAAVADELADAFGDRNLFALAVVDDSSNTVLSSGEGLGDRGDPMEAAGFISASRPVAETTWSVDAGADPTVALAPARSVLLRGVALGAVVLLVLLAALALVNRRIAHPLRRLAEVVGDSGPHAEAALGQIRGPSEIVRLGADFRAAMEARERFEIQLAKQEFYDPVTGVANRALLAERLNHSLEHADRTRAIVGALFIDLDRFKLINESFGHAVGDEVLIGVAERLKLLLRAGDTLARFGGDEFVIVRVDCEHQDLDGLPEQVLACLNEPLEVADSIVRVTASIGIASSTPEHRGSDLLHDAHAAMYLAKEQGRARWERFDPTLHARATTRLAMETELQSALERDQLRVVYQPKVDLQTSAIIGVEALLRWEHPGLGSVPPDTFIPIAEETGLMIPIGRFVLTQACEQAAAWEREGVGVPVAVNVSGRQFDDPDFAAQVEQILDAVGLPPACLCLEVTETLLMSDTVRSTQLMREIHAVGVRLSIDDFGTGYSSLAYLHRFAFDELKIDRVFIDGMIELAGQRTLVEATVAMGKALGLSIVAEGVETEAQASLLRELGCETAQGYLFARPLPPDALRLPAAALSTAEFGERLGGAAHRSTI